jgi:hypothetical protein
MIEMALGTELSVLKSSNSSDSWVLVRTIDGQEGWVVGRLTSSFDSEHYNETVEGIVQAQLKLHEQIPATSFEARVQLFSLIERATSKVTEREVLAGFALYRLRSMRDVFLGVPFGGNQRDPYQGWLMRHWDAGRYDEPSGSWMVEPEYVLKIHEQYRTTNAADDIAWFYVTNGSGGECEGFLPCYVGSLDGLEGDYLRLHPRGSHTEEAVASLAKTLDALEGDREGLDCPSFRESLQSLASAINASRSAKSKRATAAVKKIAELSTFCS